MSIYLSSAYLAPIEYYSYLFNCENVVIERHENYIKQSYRNRCIILSANGPMTLSIPVESNNGKKCPIKDVRIADHGNWRHLHWNTLVSAYNSTPFFEYYQDDLCPFYEKKFEFLFDFNEELRILISGWLNMDISNVRYTDEFVLKPEKVDKDYRELISPKKDWRITNPEFTPVPYYQVFEDRYGFVENLSIVDLLFNMGNEGALILSKSIKKTF